MFSKCYQNHQAVWIAFELKNHYGYGLLKIIFLKLKNFVCCSAGCSSCGFDYLMWTAMSISCQIQFLMTGSITNKLVLIKTLANAEARQCDMYVAASRCNNGKLRDGGSLAKRTTTFLPYCGIHLFHWVRWTYWAVAISRMSICYIEFDEQCFIVNRILLLQ